jgi:hypothetical protein
VRVARPRLRPAMNPCLGALEGIGRHTGGPRNSEIGVLKNLAQEDETLVRIEAVSVQGSCNSRGIDFRDP